MTTMAAVVARRTRSSSCMAACPRSASASARGPRRSWRPCGVWRPASTTAAAAMKTPWRPPAASRMTSGTADSVVDQPICLTRQEPLKEQTIRKTKI